MAPINPWLARLVETELDNVIAWKSIVKPEPGANDEGISPRFSDDGSNLRSFVGSPPLDSESTIQLLEKPGSNARAKIPVSDGDVSVLAVLSDAAWEAYDKAIEEEGGDEPRKGDLLVCKRITVVSTTWGPSDEHVKLRIEDLELAGNIRKTIGNPTSLLQRDSIATLCKRIEKLRLGSQQSDAIEENDASEEEDDDDDEEEEGVSEEEARGTDHEADANLKAAAIDATADILHDAVPNASTRSKISQEDTVSGATISPRIHTSPIVSRSPASVQIESQLAIEMTQIQPPPQPRNPVKRSRGGYSMGREGFEPTRGDNLTGPQAPTLHQNKGFSAMEPPKSNLLGILSKMPGQLPKKRSLEPFAPVSAQVVTEDVVLETPAKRQRTTIPSTTQQKPFRIPSDQQMPDSPFTSLPSGPGQRSIQPNSPNEATTKRKRAASTLESTSTPLELSRHRIPRDQLAIFGDKLSPPEHQSHCANVPTELSELWDLEAAKAAESPSQPSPIALIEQSSRAKSIEEVQPGSRATAEYDFESSSDESSDSEKLPWSQSPSRSQKLPPDSSAEPSSMHASRLVLRNVTTSTHGPEPSLIENAGLAIPSSKVGAVQSISRQQDSPNQKAQPSMSQSSRNEGSRSVPHTPNTISAGRRDAQPNSAIRGGGQHAAGSVSSSNPRQRDLLTNSIRSQATPVASEIAKQQGSQQSTSMPPTSGANARPVASQNQRRTSAAHAATQKIPTGPKKIVPLADNHRGPLLSSSQRSEPRQRPTDQRVSSTPTPLGAPTGPKAHRNPQYNLPHHGNGHVRTFPRPSQSGNDFYRPSPSADRKDPRVPTHASASKQHPGGSQAPNGTSEMETAVPRSLPPSKHHQQRSEYMRGAQRDQWLGMRFSACGQGMSSTSTSQLCRLYRIRYSNDPVSEHDFAKLVEELRPQAERSSVPPENEEDVAEAASPTSRALTEEPPSRAHSGPQVESIGHDSPPSPQPPPNGIFAEFANRWKNMRPDAALARDGLSHGKAPKRKLNVLGWGIG